MASYLDISSQSCTRTLVRQIIYGGDKMKIDTSKIQDGDLEKLRIKLKELLAENKLPEEFSLEEDIEAIVYFLYYVQHNHEEIVSAIEEIDIVESDENDLNPFEKSIQTIALNDQLDRILTDGKQEKSGWKYNRLSIFLSFGSHNKNEKNKDPIERATRALYDKYKNAIYQKIFNMKRSKKTKYLVEKYPEMDIVKILSYAVLTKKIELTHEDVEWLDNVLALACSSKKQGREQGLIG